jgi:uncharacterized protein
VVSGKGGQQVRETSQLISRREHYHSIPPRPEVYTMTTKKAQATPAVTASPTFRTLARHEIDAILDRNHVGRMAFTFHDRVDITPLHYVYDQGWLYGRTSLGTKLSVISHHQWVAFEVDESEGLLDWRSVVVKGHFEILQADLAPVYAQAFTRAVELVRQLAPDALTPEDRTPFRKVLFRIHLDEVTGRESTTAS